MGGVLAALLVVAALAALVVLVARTWTPSPATDRRDALPIRQRAEVAQALAGATWAAAHDEADGVTRVLLRRSCTGPDGWPIVLEERVFATLPSDDPAWEARFTEAMAAARFRSDYLNREEFPG